MTTIELVKHAKILEKLVHEQVYEIKPHEGISPILLVEFLLQVAVMVEHLEKRIDALAEQPK